MRMASLGIVPRSLVSAKRARDEPGFPEAMKGTPMKKVLIADDYPDMRELLGRQIESLGFLPILAENGKDVLEKAIREKPRLIMLDMIMPIMDGWQAVRSLRANPETKDIPILAATALFHQSDLNTCIEQGCNGYINKPFTMMELKKKVAELIR
jgi:two-component system cell cycle response regulator DivK